MLEEGRGVQQSLHLGQGQHDRDLAHVGLADQLARQIGPVERVCEEEPQRRDDAVHCRRRNPELLLLDLKPADFLGCRGVRRAPQPGREPPHVADIVALRLPRKPAHGHVIYQPLTQRAGSNYSSEIVHRSTPRVKGAEWCAR